MRAYLQVQRAKRGRIVVCSNHLSSEEPPRSRCSAATTRKQDEARVGGVGSEHQTRTTTLLGAELWMCTKYLR